MELVCPGVWHDPFKESDNVYRQPGTASKKFLDYRERFASPLGQAINAWRAWWVTSTIEKHGLPALDATVLDYGAGVGAFLSQMADKCADLLWAEINEFMVGDLVFHYPDMRQYTPGYPVDVLTLWDVFEHLADPWGLLGAINPAHVFLTIPIIAPSADPKKSKHYKPNEHQWYWTLAGFMGEARKHGWRAHAPRNNPESETFDREWVYSVHLRRDDNG